MCPSCESSAIPWRRKASGRMAASLQVRGQLHAPFALPKGADWSNRPVRLKFVLIVPFHPSLFLL